MNPPGKWSRAALAACALAELPTAFAEPHAAGAQPRAVATLGQVNFVDQGDGLAGGGVEYRWAPLGSWSLIPGVGFTLAETGAVYGYAALHYDFHLGRTWILTPVLGAGLFRNGGDLDLGHAVEFKSGLELSVRVAGGWRIGLQGYHLSNASLSADNPGTEVIELVVAVPLGGE
jgi:lipid A 3-O-deacylase